MPVDLEDILLILVLWTVVSVPASLLTGHLLHRCTAPVPVPRPGPRHRQPGGLAA